MSRFYRALLVVLAFEMGAMLLYLPWSVYWEQNFFLSHYPSLMRIVLHPSFRGAVSGVGTSEEHTSELQSPCNIVCRLLLEKNSTSRASNAPPVTIPQSRGHSPRKPCIASTTCSKSSQATRSQRFASPWPAIFSIPRWPARRRPVV